MYARFEPVPAPLVVPRSAKTEGEHLDRLVIRSNYNSPFEGPNTRWVVAPKTSELGAEQHGMFDLSTGVDGALATYQMIAARERRVVPQAGAARPGHRRAARPQRVRRAVLPGRQPPLPGRERRTGEPAVPAGPDLAGGLSSGGSRGSRRAGWSRWGSGRARGRTATRSSSRSSRGAAPRRSTDGTMTVELPKATVARVRAVVDGPRVADLDEDGHLAVGPRAEPGQPLDAPGPRGPRPALDDHAVPDC